jgi:mono/diheme cytochrome c family protein
METMRTTTLALSGLLALSVLGCRGSTFTQTPIHPNPNMDNVTYIESQEPAEFFADGRGMRTPPEGTVARGQLRDDDHLWRGVENHAWATRLPDAVIEHFGGGDEGADVLAAVAERGAERYGIYCTPCHGDAGLENGGIVPRRGNDGGRWMWSVPSLHGERQRGYSVGQLYNIVSNGFNTMPAYAAQIPVHDRWAIATYVRVLQISQGAPIAVVPPAVAQAQGWNR